MTKVEIGKKVDYPTLENALKQAAKELGLKIKVKENYDKEYKLGSVHEEKKYTSTEFNLKGAFLPAMTVTVYGKGPKDYFFIDSCIVRGFALPSDIKKYLNSVSKHLYKFS